jgi:hypothetical protein
MTRARAPHAYVAVVVVTAAQLLALRLIGDTRCSLTWLGVTAGLIVLLGFGSRAAWWLLLLTNAVAVLGAAAVAVTGGAGTTDWGDVAALVLGSGTLVALLGSPSMRAHLRRGG